MMTVTGPYERPTRSRALHPFVQRDFPEIRRDKLKGKILSRNEFAQAAAQRPSPLAELDKAITLSKPADPARKVMLNGMESEVGFRDLADLRASLLHQVTTDR